MHATSTAGVPAALAPLLANARSRDGEVRDEPRACEGGRLHGHRHAPDPGHGLALHESGQHEVRHHEATDPRLRQARIAVAARCVRVGVPRQACQGAASRSDVRVVRGCVSLQGRATSSQPRREDECAQKSPESGAAFAFWHPDFVTLAPVALVPEPRRHLRGDEPAHAALQQGLDDAREMRRAPGTRKCPARRRARRQRVAAGRSSCPKAARSTNSPTPGSATSSSPSTSTLPRSSTISGEPVTSVPS